MLKLPDDRDLRDEEGGLRNLLHACKDPKKLTQFRRQAEREFDEILKDCRNPSETKKKVEKFAMQMMVLGMAHILPSLAATEEISEVGRKLQAPLKHQRAARNPASAAVTALSGDAFDWGNEKRLWLKSPMKEEERKVVIGAHFKFCQLITRTPPGQVLYDQFQRAIRRHVRLTFKQWQAASLVVSGLDVKEISSRLKISERMVKTHLQAVRRKAHLNRRSGLVRWYLGL